MRLEISFIDKKRGILVVLVLAVIFIIFILFLKREAKSELVYFYPQSCLGSFINPEKAQGDPEATNQDLINESNSAVYLGGFKEIYCGNFQGPIKEGEIQSINLKFNMVLTNERREAPIIEPTSSEPFIEKILPPKTIEIINTSTENPTNSPYEPITTSTPDSSSTSTIEIPQSFFYKIVFAQEAQINADDTRTDANHIVDRELMRTDTNESESMKTTGTLDLPTTSTENEQITSTPFTSEIPIEPIFNYFDVFYTLDGINWQYLGSITNHNWQNISFSIPVNDWLTISKIQIKIQSNPSLDNIPYLYLESRSLEVETVEKNNDKDINNSVNSVDCLEFENKINEIEKIMKDLENKKELITPKRLDDHTYIYQLELENDNYEAWIVNKDLPICRKIEGLRLENLPVGFYENIFFYIDKNNVLNGYDIISNNKFTITFENEMMLQLADEHYIKLNLKNSNLEIIPIEKTDHNQ